MKTFKLILTDSGDSSVGMFPVYEEIKVSFEYGGHDKESAKEFKNQLAKLIKDCFSYGTGRVKIEETR